MAAFTGTLAALYTAGHKLIDTELKTWYDALNALCSPWAPYTPALTNGTLGNGSIVGQFVQVGKFVSFRWTWVLGSSSAVGAGLSVSLPVTGLDANWAGSAFLFDASSPAGRTVGVLNGSTSTTQVFGPTGGLVTSTVPFTWATGDVIKGSGTYEAA